MIKKNAGIEGRRSLLTGLGFAAAGIAATAAAPAQAQRARGFTPERHELDAWMDEIPGSHRIFVDTASSEGGVDALRYVSNIYNAHGNAYSGSDDDLAVIICFRHFSTPYGYTNALWEKYGATFRSVMQLPSTGAPPTVNPVIGTGSAPGGFAIFVDSLIARGTHFAVCESATSFIASQAAAATGQTADAVFAEITANGIPNAHFVPAGVMALTRAQEHGYSLLVAG